MPQGNCMYAEWLKKITNLMKTRYIKDEYR